MRRIWVALGVAAAAYAGEAHAEGVRFGGNDVTSVFVIAKSENRNQVAYGIALDERCAPRGAAPVVPYWKTLERGPNVTEPLAAHEQGVYGVASQRVTARPNGGTVRIALRALPDRAIAIETSKQNDRCVATATLAIAGTPARLTSVFAQLKWPFGVDYLMLNGAALEGGRAVREKIAS